jgi:hypothetical protein
VPLNENEYMGTNDFSFVMEKSLLWENNIKTDLGEIRCDG